MGTDPLCVIWVSIPAIPPWGRRGSIPSICVSKRDHDAGTRGREVAWRLSVSGLDARREPCDQDERRRWTTNVATRPRPMRVSVPGSGTRETCSDATAKSVFDEDTGGAA